MSSYCTVFSLVGGIVKYILILESLNATIDSEKQKVYKIVQFLN